MFPLTLKQICNKIPFDKSSLKKTQNRSAESSQALRYSSYVNNNRRIYKRIIEGQVYYLNMISATPNTATITYSSVANPIYVSMIAVNIQDITDAHQVDIYSNPYVFQNLKPNSYYTINAYTVYTSGNRYLNVFNNAILTLNEGPPLEPIIITNPEYDSAILKFVFSIGDPTSFDLTVINVDNTSDINYYPNITSPYLITGLKPNFKYDISLSSFYSSSNNTYYIRKSGINGFFFQTYNENYPVFINVSNITNISATIHFSFTGEPSYNFIQITNALDPSDVYSVTDIERNTAITFSNIRINSTYDLRLISYYNATEHSYITNKTKIFTTLLENEVSNIIITHFYGNRLDISFSPTVGEVYSYVINLNGISNGQQFEISYNTYPSFVTFSNLIYNTEYILTVQTRYISNNYTSPPLVVKTLNEESITDLSYSNIENTSAHISFRPSPGNNPTYYISYSGIRNNTTTYYIDNLKETSVDLSGLTINTPYTVTVNTYYTDPDIYDSFNIYSSTYNGFFTTLNQRATTIFNIDVSSTYIDVTFINTYGIPSSYLLKAVDIYNNNIQNTYNGRADTTHTFRLSGLSTSTSYTVSINTEYIENNNTRYYLTTYPNPIITLP